VQKWSSPAHVPLAFVLSALMAPQPVRQQRPGSLPHAQCTVCLSHSFTHKKCGGKFSRQEGVGGRSRRQCRRRTAPNKLAARMCAKRRPDVLIRPKICQHNVWVMARQAIPTSIHFNVCTNIYSVTVINTHVKPLKMIFYCRPLNVFYIFEPVRYRESHRMYVYGGARCQVASHALVKIIFLMIIFCLYNKLYRAAAAPLHARGSLHGYLCSSKLNIVSLLLFIIFKSSLQNSENLSAHTQSINFPTYDKCIKCHQLLSLIAMFGTSPIHVCIPPHMWMQKRGSSVEYADSKTQEKIKIVLLIFFSSATFDKE
jgi:hypothetical protein